MQCLDWMFLHGYPPPPLCFCIVLLNTEHVDQCKSYKTYGLMKIDNNLNLRL